ncbi:hypothetical protein [Lewinella sp. IMCC34191]|uniref:hypothetical protein n=1 Tax=Lewinella sp. IMCC34191 TaxID=2259172 RepID=UPI000E25657F|nr:hypothetical protein [Lewinella sp. IMCC34191]
MKTTYPQLLFGRLYFLILFLLTTGLSAQDSLAVPGHLEVELEPAAFIFRGYSINIGYQTGPIRISVKSFAANQPRLILGNTIFAIQSSGIGFEADYLFRPRSTPFVGLLSDYHSDQLFASSGGATGVRQSVSAGVRLGYRYFFAKLVKPYRGFYLSGSVAAFTKLSGAQLEIDGRNIPPRPLYLIPAVNVGYHF